MDMMIEKMTTSLDLLKFGGGIVPAPLDDDFLQVVSELHATWHPFELALHGLVVDAHDRRLRAGRVLAGAPAPAATVTYASTTVPQLVSKEKETSEQSESFLNKLVGASGLGVPGLRLKLVSRQRMLVNKMVKESLLLKYGHSGSNFDPLNAAIGGFMGLAKTLTDGGDGIPALIKQRKDLETRIEATENAFASFEANIRTLAESSSNNDQGIEDVEESLELMEDQLDLLSTACAEEDPEVEAGNGWTRIIYLGLVFPSCLLVICSGVYKGWAKRS
jgi:hypothetical protein